MSFSSLSSLFGSKTPAVETAIVPVTPADTAAVASPGLLRLDPGTWLDRVRQYAELVRTKRETAAAAKAADDAHKAARAAILRAMNYAPAAACGPFVLGYSEKGAAAASITLKDGRKVMLSAVTSILVGNETIAADQIGSLYGGRSAAPELTVNG